VYIATAHKPANTICLAASLFVSNHFAKVGDVMLDSGDFLWPGTWALVRYSGSILSFRFGERDGKVLQFLFKRWARHTQRVSLRKPRNDAFGIEA
jgi:hypothetical protein